MDLSGGARIQTQKINRSSLRNAEFNKEFEERSKATLVCLVGQAINRVDFIKNHEEQLKKMGIVVSPTERTTPAAVPDDPDNFESILEIEDDDQII